MRSPAMGINSNHTSMSFNVNKLSPDNAKAIAIVLVVVVVLIFAVYWLSKTFGGISNLFGSIKGVFTDDPATADRKQKIADAATAAATPTSPWSPSFYQNAPAGASLFTSSYADTLCEQIWDTVSWFQFGPPDGAQMEGAIKQCSTQSQVSFLADRFQQKYSKDLYSWLTSCFTATLDSPNVYTMTVVNDYVKNLPKYN